MQRKPTFLDRRGKPVQRAVLKQEVSAPTLGGVRSPISGSPGDGLNPLRLASILRAADAGDPIRYLELAEVIEERDPHYLAVLSTRKRAVGQIDITVEAASDDAADVKKADMVRDWLKRDELVEDQYSTFWIASARVIPLPKSSGTHPRANGGRPGWSGAIRAGSGLIGLIWPRLCSWTKTGRKSRLIRSNSFTRRSRPNQGWPYARVWRGWRPGVGCSRLLPSATGPYLPKPTASRCESANGPLEPRKKTRTHCFARRARWRNLSKYWQPDFPILPIQVWRKSFRGR